MTKRPPSTDTVEEPRKRLLQFPRFTRFISAFPVKGLLRPLTGLFLWTLIVGLIVINAALTNQGLARRVFERTGMAGFAARLRLPVASILGASTAKPSGQETPAALVSQYEQWNRIVSEYPDYRDGHFMLAVLSYQLGNESEARTHLADVRALDPNYPGIIELEKLLSND